jgi:hypothetical protein
MRHRGDSTLPLLRALLLALASCGSGGLAPRLSITLGHRLARSVREDGGRTHAANYALLTASLVQEPPAAPAVVTRPPATPTPTPPACLGVGICGAVERARLSALRREIAVEGDP